ncbi:B12-binding domain-containing radical SAM protein [bacterium]|nr:B12-binding domain-containing radical SAM protein [bacterium]
MRVLFIIPPHPSRDMPISDGMPLGTLYLASMIRESHDVQIIDAYSQPSENIASHIIEFSPDVVAISIPFRLVEKTAQKTAQEVRENSNAKIIIGGIHATLASERIRESISHDFFIPGEAELKFKSLIESLDAGSTDFPDGVLSESDSPDIDKLPLPARDLLQNREIYTERILTSRGCGFNCGFCSSKKFWGAFRGRNPDLIIDELEFIYSERGFVPVSFADDSFTYDRKRVIKFCDRMMERKIKTGRLGFSSHPIRLDEEILEKTREVGFDSIFLGLESANPEILRFIGKTYDHDKIERLIEYGFKLGFEIHASFMIGLPKESREDIERTLMWAGNMPLNSIGFHIFYPFEGCAIRENPDKYGIKIQERPEHVGDIDGEAVIHNGVLSSTEILYYYYRAKAMARQKNKHKSWIY